MGGLGYHGYSAYVRNQAGVHYLSEWRSRVDGHGAQVPYNLLQSCPYSLLKSAQLAVLPWDIQLGLRSFCRLRAGLVRVRALKGRRSRARFQDCIACSHSVRNATNHAVAQCSSWSAPREAFFIAHLEARKLLTGALCLAILRCPWSKACRLQLGAHLVIST